MSSSNWQESRPKSVDSAPCQEVVLTGDDVDLGLLPIIKCWPLDAGRYITLPLVCSYDPNTGKRNVGCYRMQVLSKNTTAMHWQRHKGGREHYDDSVEKKERLQLAVALGAEPAAVYSGTAPLPQGIDEFLFAGFLRGGPVQLVKGKTVDVMVPANSEIVLEGYVEPGEYATEGPFGDHTGYYSTADEYPVFHVTAITHRRDPDIRDYHRGPTADGRSLHGQSHRADFLAAHQDDGTGGGRHRAAGRGSLPQHRLRCHQEALPRPRAQDHVRALELCIR